MNLAALNFTRSDSAVDLIQLQKKTKPRHSINEICLELYSKTNRSNVVRMMKYYRAISNRNNVLELILRCLFTIGIVYGPYEICIIFPTSFKSPMSASICTNK